MKRKLIAAALCAAMILSFAACTDGNKGGNTGGDFTFTEVMSDSNYTNVTLSVENISTQKITVDGVAEEPEEYVNKEVYEKDGTKYKMVQKREEQPDQIAYCSYENQKFYSYANNGGKWEKQENLHFEDPINVVFDAFKEKESWFNKTKTGFKMKADKLKDFFTEVEGAPAEEIEGAEISGNIEMTVSSKKVSKLVMSFNVTMSQTVENVESKVEMSMVFEAGFTKFGTTTVTLPTVEEPQVTLDGIKTVLEAEGYTVGSESVPGAAAIVGTKENETVAVIVFATEQLATAAKPTYDTAAEAVPGMSCKQSGTFVYYGTSAAMAVVDGVFA